MNESGGMEKPNVGEGRDRIEHGQSDIRPVLLSTVILLGKSAAQIITSVLP